MKVNSIIENGYGFSPIEVEVALYPGIPQFILSGLPDPVIKESLVRIQSAIRAQGFVLPTRDKVYINLKPAYEKKRSRGVELAIAYAYLRATDQVPEMNIDDLFVYGELGLGGEVSYLADIEWVDNVKFVVTGKSESGSSKRLLSISCLKDLRKPDEFSQSAELICPSAPNLTNYFWPKAAADALKIISLGMHHSFLAGPAGTGKTTFAKSLHQLLPELTAVEWREIKKWHRGLSVEWRPLRMPHHTTTPQALIGGGNPPEPGEITKAAHGLLFLDEFLEFPPVVREAMREPMESQEITISRKGQSQKFPAQFLLLAASNLCPCGDYVPNESVNCRMSLMKCRSYLEKLSGPLLDRFDILTLSNQWRKSEFVSVVEIKSDLLAAREFLKSRKSEPSSFLQEDKLIGSLKSKKMIELLPQSSRRRSRALLRVARTLADLDKSDQILMKHLDQAYDWAVRPFIDMRRA